ncbi:unnamed protein product [Bursaphelenchus okinawaensis]|uniref:Uncharacterized protein n=1 Tax=Bursaphelenchus okinawaensis TaxID=465554 RepID=A0A811JRZ4_9BILA|nr:unnamed protein product [Bursaphelenchus okinawaensis]CAG9080349.1 unnamed protein product [Bursaphelenchus okinawaensis]
MVATRIGEERASRELNRLQKYHRKMNVTSAKLIGPHIDQLHALPVAKASKWFAQYVDYQAQYDDLMHLVSRIKHLSSISEETKQKIRDAISPITGLMTLEYMEAETKVKKFLATNSLLKEIQDKYQIERTSDSASWRVQASPQACEEMDAIRGEDDEKEEELEGIEDDGNIFISDYDDEAEGPSDDREDPEYVVEVEAPKKTTRKARCKPGPKKVVKEPERTRKSRDDQPKSGEGNFDAGAGHSIKSIMGLVGQCSDVELRTLQSCIGIMVKPKQKKVEDDISSQDGPYSSGSEDERLSTISRSTCRSRADMVETHKTPEEFDTFCLANEVTPNGLVCKCRAHMITYGSLGRGGGPTKIKPVTEVSERAWKMFINRFNTLVAPNTFYTPRAKAAMLRDNMLDRILTYLEGIDELEEVHRVCCQTYGIDDEPCKPAEGLWT